MRKKTIKMLAMATVATACFATATACLKIEEVSAESAFTMMNGAAVLMNDTADESAIRFVANVPDMTDKSYRMLILPTKILEANEIEAEDDVVGALKGVYKENYENYFVDLAVTPFAHEEYGNVVMGAMKKVDSERYAEEYTAIAYYMEGTEYVYAEFSEGVDIYSNARSVSYVASAALNSGDYETADKSAQKTVLENFVSNAIVDDSFDIAQNDELVKISDEFTLTANVKDTTTLDIKYVSSDENVATVNENGKVSIVGAGTATVTAKIGASFEDAVNITAFSAGDKADMLVQLEEYLLSRES